MHNREKVMAHLRVIYAYTAFARKRGTCFLGLQAICDIEERASDALALLEEQDGKPMIENERGWNCPSCGMNLIGKTASGYPCDLFDLPEDEPIHFCPMCGQAVKWE